jgi:sugar fermentation stimulation protein A
LEFKKPLVYGTLRRRYQRFLADVELDSGELITAFCPNTGSMKSCNIPGSPVYLSESFNPKRKLKYTWELIFTNGVWVGINTGLPNKIVKEAILDNKISQLQGYPNIQTEVRYGENSRVDLLLKNNQAFCYIEIKNVTFVENNDALFPDAITLRGQKHLKELIKKVNEGNRAVNFFVVPRADARRVKPADKIDPEYGALLRIAQKRGVEILAYQADVKPKRITLSHQLPVIL